jgi:hypothetical protein
MSMGLKCDRIAVGNLLVGEVNVGNARPTLLSSPTPRKGTETFQCAIALMILLSPAQRFPAFLGNAGNLIRCAN